MASRNSLLEELDAVLPDSTVPAGARPIGDSATPQEPGPAAAGGCDALNVLEVSQVEGWQASSAGRTARTSQNTGRLEQVENATVSHLPAARKSLHASGEAHSESLLAAMTLLPGIGEDGTHGGLSEADAVASNTHIQYQPSFAAAPPTHRQAGLSSPPVEQRATEQREHDRGPGTPWAELLPKGKQVSSTFSFQDIMQGRPSSSGRMPSYGKPPLPRMPGSPASGMHTQPCAACEQKEQQVSDLSAKVLKSVDEVAAMRKELIELDGHCEALEQLVGDRESQVLEIEGIAADQAARIDKLQAEQEAVEGSHRSSMTQLQGELARLTAQVQSAADREAATGAAAAAAADASAKLTAQLHAKVTQASFFARAMGKAPCTTAFVHRCRLQILRGRTQSCRLLLWQQRRAPKRPATTCAPKSKHSRQQRPT